MAVLMYSSLAAVSMYSSQMAVFLRLCITANVLCTIILNREKQKNLRAAIWLLYIRTAARLLIHQSSCKLRYIKQRIIEQDALRCIEFHVFKKVHIFRDNVPTISLATWELLCSLFDGSTLAGPEPVLFSEDAEASREGLNENLIRAHKELQRVMITLFMPESLDLEAAISLVKKPR
jgi:hypothetical protein